MLRLGVNCCLLEACAAPPHVRLSADSVLEYLSSFRVFLNASKEKRKNNGSVSLQLWSEFEKWRGMSTFSSSDIESIWIVFATIAIDSSVAVLEEDDDPMKVSISLAHFSILLLLQIRRSEARFQQAAARTIRTMETANSASAAQCTAAATSALLSPRRLSNGGAGQTPGSRSSEDIVPSTENAESYLAFVFFNLNNFLRACCGQCVGRLPASISIQAVDNLALLLDTSVQPSLGHAVAAALGVGNELPWNSTAALLQSVLRVDPRRQLATRRGSGGRRRSSAVSVEALNSPRGTLAVAAGAASLEQAHQSGGSGVAATNSSCFLRSPYAVVLDGIKRESVYIDKQRAVRVRQRRSSQLQQVLYQTDRQVDLEKQEKQKSNTRDEIFLDEASDDGSSVTGNFDSGPVSAGSKNPVLQSVHLLDLQDCTVVLLRPVRYLMINSCLNCTVIAVTVSCLVSLQACKYVKIHASARAVRFENCYGPHANIFCHAPPAVCGDTRSATLGPLSLVYPELPVTMAEGGLSVVHRFVNRFAFPIVSDAAASTAHRPFEIRVKEADKVTHSDAYQLLHPDKLEIITLPSDDPDLPLYAVPLPEVYHEAYLKRNALAGEVMASLDKRSRDFEGGPAAFSKALQLHFMSWLIREGHMKELSDFCRLEASAVLKP